MINCSSLLSPVFCRAFLFPVIPAISTPRFSSLLSFPEHAVLFCDEGAFGAHDVSQFDFFPGIRSVLLYQDGTLRVIPFIVEDQSLTKNSFRKKSPRIQRTQESNHFLSCYPALLFKASGTKVAVVPVGLA